jgi:hypothetical protein
MSPRPRDRGFPQYCQSRASTCRQARGFRAGECHKNRIGHYFRLSSYQIIGVLADYVDNLAALFPVGEIEISPFRHTCTRTVAEIDFLTVKISERDLFPVQFLKYLAQMITPSTTILHDFFVDCSAALVTGTPSALSQARFVALRKLTCRRLVFLDRCATFELWLRLFACGLNQSTADLVPARAA